MYLSVFPHCHGYGVAFTLLDLRVVAKDVCEGSLDKPAQPINGHNNNSGTGFHLPMGIMKHDLEEFITHFGGQVRNDQTKCNVSGDMT